MASLIDAKRLAVDIGGTFTDVVLEFETRRWTAKVLTTPAAPEKGAVDGVGAVLQRASLGAEDIDVFIHGTTLATNALIERTGAVTALVTTDGFRDTLDIGYESRYDQYDVFIDKVCPLVPRYLRLTVPERIDFRGNVLRSLDERAVRAVVPELLRHRVESVAVGFLHSYANPAHEARVRELLLEALPHLSVTLSSEVSPEVREYERISTACANAYIQPLMARYLRNLRDELSWLGMRAPIYLMTSGGGLTTLETAVACPIRLVESGPAGGVILAAQIAAECGCPRVTAFDMGGTTAKICLVEDYEPQRARSFEVDRAARFLKGSGLPLRIPVIEMVEIGAGGGSIARVDPLRRIVVGPTSAGAEPGPASYGRGGEDPTVTDADVVLGRIDPAGFAGGSVSIDPSLALGTIKREVADPLDLPPDVAAFGIAEVVDERMASAARVHAVERGKNIADHMLIAFGGAAPLHACRLARKLGITRIVVPTDAGVGAAVGFLRAPIAYEVVRSLHMRLDRFDVAAANRVLAGMRDEAHAVVRAGAPREALSEARSAFMRYVGQGHEIVVTLPCRDLGPGDAGLLRDAFDRQYKALNARAIPGAPVEILTWTVTVSTMVAPPAALPPSGNLHAPRASGRRRLFDPERQDVVDVSTYRRVDLAPGARIAGPAIIVEDQTSTVVTEGFSASVLSNGSLLLEHGSGLEGDA